MRRIFTIFLFATFIWKCEDAAGQVKKVDTTRHSTGKPAEPISNIGVDDGGPGGSLESCLTADAGSNVTIYCGQSTSIGTTISAYYTYSWSPTAGLSSSTSGRTTASPKTTTTYTLTMTPKVNMLVNGNFESGYTGFTSDYTQGISSYSTQVNDVATDPFSYYSWWCNSPAPAGPSMLVCDGATTSGQRVWAQSVSVSPGIAYTFSGQFLNLYNTSGINDPNIIIKINGTILYNGPLYHNDCNWETISVPWTAGVFDSYAAIEIYSDPSVCCNANGNDFAIDNLTFVEGSCAIVTDQVTVTVNPVSAITADVYSGQPWQTISTKPNGDVISCAQYEGLQTLNLTSSMSSGFTWYQNGAPLSTTAQTITSQAYAYSGPVPFTYTIVDGTTGCPSTPLKVVFVPLPQAFAYQVSGNDYAAYTFDYGPGTTYSWSISDPNASFVGSANQRAVSFSFPSGYHPTPFLVGSNLVTTQATVSISGSYYDCVNTSQADWFRIMKINPTSQGRVLPEDDISQVIYPNPAKNTVMVHAKKVFNKIQLYTVNGALAITVNKTDTNAMIDVSGLPPGTYLVKIIMDHEVRTEKLVIMK